MVRKFKLLNEKGQSYSLMDIQKNCLLTDPSGLGYSYTTEYEQLENTFVENMRKMDKGQISGIVNFSKYDNYKKLVDFIESSETLKIAYTIPFETGEKEYLKDIKIQSLNKTQKRINGILSEEIIFDCLSLWYEENTVIYKIEPNTNEIRWDFKWDSKFKDYNTRKLTYKNIGHVEAPIEVEIDGAVYNPKIEVYISDELYQEVPINTQIEEYEKLIYSSKENEFAIKKIRTDGTEESLFNLDIIDFYNDNVVRLPKGYECEIRLVADNTIQNAKITILPQYVAV